MPESLALIAIIGPADHDLVVPFVAHYTGLGVEEFRFAVHSPEGTRDEDEDRLLAACRAAGHEPEIVSRGGWTGRTNVGLRERMRQATDAEWHLLADVDELQHHPGGLDATLVRCRERGDDFATGMIVDRLAASGDGSGEGATTVRELDALFPRGGFLTGTLMDGDPRKVTIAHRRLTVGAGNHHTPDHWHYEYPPPQPVHHFKWRKGVVEKLRRRAASHPAQSIIDECNRAIELVSDGVAVAEEQLPTFPASVDRVPENWEAMIEPIWRYWMVERWWEGVDAS